MSPLRTLRLWSSKGQTLSCLQCVPVERALLTLALPPSSLLLALESRRDSSIMRPPSSAKSRSIRQSGVPGPQIYNSKPSTRQQIPLRFRGSAPLAPISELPESGLAVVAIAVAMATTPYSPPECGRCLRRLCALCHRVDTHECASEQQPCSLFYTVIKDALGLHYQ